MHDRILYSKIDWLERYQGEARPPTPFGLGALCGERFNFMPFHDGVFGAVPRLKGFGLRQADHYPWLVIWIARPPIADHPGEYERTYWPVGWYEQATLLTNHQDRPEYPDDPNFPMFGNGRFTYIISTKANNAYLIPAENRRLYPEIPTKPLPSEPTRFGSAMILYARCPGKTETWREKYALIAEEIASRPDLAQQL